MKRKGYLVDRHISLSFASLLTLLLCGCVIERSIRHQEPFARFIGRQFTMQKTMFLVDHRNGTHDLSGEDQKGQAL